MCDPALLCRCGFRLSLDPGSGTASHRARSHLLPTPGVFQGCSRAWVCAWHRPPEHPLGQLGSSPTSPLLMEPLAVASNPKVLGFGPSQEVRSVLRLFPGTPGWQALPAPAPLWWFPWCTWLSPCLAVARSWKCAFPQPDFLCDISCSASSVLNADVSHGISAVS